MQENEELWDWLRNVGPPRTLLPQPEEEDLWDWLRNAKPEPKPGDYLEGLTSKVMEGFDKPPEAPVAPPVPRERPTDDHYKGMPTLSYTTGPRPLEIEPQLPLERVTGPIPRGTTDLRMIAEAERDARIKKTAEEEASGLAPEPEDKPNIFEMVGKRWDPRMRPGPPPAEPVERPPYRLPDDPREVVSEIGLFQANYDASKRRLAAANVDIKDWLERPSLVSQVVGLSALAKKGNWAVFFEQFDAIADNLTFGNADALIRVIEEMADLRGLRDELKKRSKADITKKFGFYPKEGVEAMRKVAGVVGTLPAYATVLTGAGALTAKIAIPLARRAAQGVIGGAMIGMLEKPEDDTFVNRLKQVPPSVAFFTLFEMGILTGGKALQIYKWSKAFKKGKFGEPVTGKHFKDIADKMTANVNGAGEVLSKEEQALYREVADLGLLRKAIKKGILKVPRKPQMGDIFKREGAFPEAEYMFPGEKAAARKPISDNEAAQMLGRAKETVSRTDIVSPEERAVREWDALAPKEKFGAIGAAQVKQKIGLEPPEFLEKRMGIVAAEVESSSPTATQALGKYVVGDAGTTDLPSVLERLLKKNKIEAPVTLTVRPRAEADWAQDPGIKGLSVGSTEGNPTEGYSMTILEIPEYGEADAYRQAGVLAHEVEHIIDVTRAGSVKEFNKAITPTVKHEGRHFLNYENFEPEAVTGKRMEFLGAGRPSPTEPGLRDPGRLTIETAPQAGGKIKTTRHQYQPEKTPEPIATPEPVTPEVPGGAEIKITRNDKGEVILTIPGTGIKAEATQEFPVKKPKPQIEIDESPVGHYKFQQEPPEPDFITKQRELSPQRKEDFYKPYGETKPPTKAEIAGGKIRYAKKIEAMKALKRYARTWGFNKEAQGGLVYNRMEGKSGDALGTLRLGKRKQTGFTFKQFDGKGNLLKEAPVQEFLSQSPKKIPREKYEKLPPRQLELQKEAKKQDLHFTKKEFEGIENKLGAAGEPFTEAEVGRLKQAGLYEEFPLKVKEEKMPPDIEREIRIRKNRPTIKRDSGQVFITNPAGEKTFLGWLPKDRLEGIKEEARKLQLTDKLTIGEAEAHVWDDYLNPADKEQEMKDYLKEASTDELEKWEAFRNSSIVKEIEEKIGQYNLFEEEMGKIKVESIEDFKPKDPVKLAADRKKALGRLKLALDGKKKYRPKVLKEELEKVGLEFPEAGMQEIERIYARKFFRDYKKKQVDGATIQGVVKTLKAAGVSDSVIGEFKFGGKPATSLIRIKKLPNDREDIVIHKGLIEHIKRGYKAKVVGDFASRFTLRYWKYFAGQEVLNAFNPPQLFFKGMGLQDVFFDPMRVGERKGFDRFNNDVEPAIKRIFKGLSKEEDRETFRYWAGRQGRGESAVEAGFTVPKLGDLNKAQRKTVAEWDELYKRMLPDLKRVTDLTGNKVEFLREYFPMFSKPSWRKMGGVAAEAKEADPGPFFPSLISRKDKVDFNVYQQSAYKNAWAFGKDATMFLELGERAAKLEYLMKSPEFNRIVTREDKRYMQKWFDYMFRPEGQDSKIMQFLRKSGYRSFFGLAVRPGLKQLLSYFDFLVLEPTMWVRASKEVKDIVKNLPLPSVGERMPLIATADATSKVDRFLLGLMIWLDKRVAGRGLRKMIEGNLELKRRDGVNIHDNKLLRRVVMEMSNIMDKIAGGVTKGQTPQIFQKEWGKAILMFQSVINNRLHAYFEAGKDKWKKGDIAALTAIITGFFFTAYLERAINKAAFDAEDAKEMLTDIAFAAGGNTPMLGTVLYGAQSGSYEMSPIITNMKETFKVAGEFARGEAGAMNLAVKTAELFGLPRQFRRTGEGIPMILEGKKVAGGKKNIPTILAKKMSDDEMKHLLSQSGQNFKDSLRAYMGKHLTEKERKKAEKQEGKRIPIEGIDEIARVFLYGKGASRRVQKYYKSSREKSSQQRNIARTLMRRMSDGEIRHLYSQSGANFNSSLKGYMREALTTAEYKHIEELEEKLEKRGLTPISLASIKAQLRKYAKAKGIIQ